MRRTVKKGTGADRRRSRKQKSFEFEMAPCGGMRELTIYTVFIKPHHWLLAAVMDLEVETKLPQLLPFERWLVVPTMGGWS